MCLTDTALNTKMVEAKEDIYETGGIQFVTFNTDRGAFQLAVYNAHNGYYGHEILIAFGDDVVCTDVL